MPPAEKDEPLQAHDQGAPSQSSSSYKAFLRTLHRLNLSEPIDSFNSFTVGFKSRRNEIGKGKELLDFGTKTSSKTSDGDGDADLERMMDIYCHIESKRRARLLKKINPKLSLSTLGLQYQRFTSRITPFIWIKDEAIDILAWKSSLKTFAFLVLYTTICLNPMIIIALPFFILWDWSLQNYSATIKAASSTPSKNQRIFPTLQSPSSSSVPMLTLKENQLALQNIQNILGYISDAYDLVVKGVSVFNWSNDDRTKRALYLSAAALLSSAILVCAIPLNIIILLAGIGLVVFTSPLFQANLLLLDIHLHYLRQSLAYWTTLPRYLVA